MTTKIKTNLDGSSTILNGVVEAIEISTGGAVSFPNTTLSTIPAGAVQNFAMNTAPTGWLKANGAAISRATYADLFAAIGTTFGVGDGSTTFNIPDLRGEFMRGWDDSRGIDSGRAFGVLQGDELRSHQHSAATYQTQGTGPNPYVGSGAIGGGFTTAAAGGAETRPRNIALLTCIKY